MAKKIISKTFRSFMSRLSTLSDNPSGICWIFNLPTELLQTITEYLNVRDVISLSRTCQMFHTLINDDLFWIHRIRCQFSPPIAQLYTFDLFQEPEHIQTDDKPRPSGFDHVRGDNDLDLLANNSATHYNDEAIERRRAKMYVSKGDFATNVQYFQFKKPKNNPKIPLMKQIYFYLIDRKRTAAVNMSVIHRGIRYLIEESDKNSLTGHVIHLQSVCWLELSGRFEHDVMPGKYEVVWRMKNHPNQLDMSGETEFTVVPSHGKMIIHKLSQDDFRTYALEYGNEWFLIKMGHIIVYELSTVLIGVRNWHDTSWKSGISWDCIELKLVS